MTGRAGWDIVSVKVDPGLVGPGPLEEERMFRIAERLDEWRRAERRRDALRPGSPAWMEADDDARRAKAAYRGEASQATAYHAELDFAAHHPSFGRSPARIGHAVVTG